MLAIAQSVSCRALMGATEPRAANYVIGLKAGQSQSYYYRSRRQARHGSTMIGDCHERAPAGGQTHGVPSGHALPDDAQILKGPSQDDRGVGFRVASRPLLSERAAPVCERNC
jgi:hypothetical protein